MAARDDMGLFSGGREGWERTRGHEGTEDEEEVGDGSDSYQSEQQNRQPKLCVRGHWRPAEDAKLRELVSKHGPQNWNLIAEKLEGRSGKSCRLRWFNQLDPRINRKTFSEEEEERLLAAHRMYGNKWALIARLFPGRTDNAVKNHWHVIMARKQREQSNAYRRRKPFLASSSPSPLLSHALLPSSKGVRTRNNTNACSADSAITSTRDESASTSTDLSLSSFTSSTVPIYSMTSGFDEKASTARKRFFNKFGESDDSFLPSGPPMVLVLGFDQPSPEASANQPVAHQVSNALPHGEPQHGRKRIMMPFIDFLGVGAT
ncbi:transcription factor CSA-like [Zingiber officinale]|uniref:Uncharacterized protein n=1 Tax=Zingiber officinale TaxID=94328 RepID=A0A8J5I7V9_ZINOF|nr:transcription factor CSA-like [Zingiber officinale]KAG6530436.1 hypothetical protein ZIOFF_012675 [Zingiber officinale]